MTWLDDVVAFANSETIRMGE